MCEDCRFGTFLDEMLRDKLVVGVNDDSIQRRLLAERDTITLNEALNIAVNMGSASKHLQGIQTKKNGSKQNFRTTTGADRKNKTRAQIDTGASVTIMGLKTWKKINNKKSLEPTKLRIKSYTGNSIHVIGQTKVPVQLDSLRWELPLIVVDGESLTLLGRN